VNKETLLPHFAKVPMLSAMPAATQMKLALNAEERNYRRRQMVQFADQPGDFVYLLCSGLVKTSRVSPAGREVIVGLISPDQIFGETGLSQENLPYEINAETMDHSMIAVFRRNDILAGLDETPAAWAALLKIISNRRSREMQALADLVFLDVPKRLAKLLIELSESQGYRASKNRQGIKKFTHQELADMIGSTRETTTLILNDFKRMDAIEFVGRCIVIRNEATLEQILSGHLNTSSTNPRTQAKAA